MQNLLSIFPSLEIIELHQPPKETVSDEIAHNIIRKAGAERTPEEKEIFERILSTPKRPVGNSWNDAKAIDPQAICEYGHSQFGFRLPREVLVVDLDVKKWDGSPESLLEAAFEEFPVLRDAPRVKTWSGGWHIYCFKDPAMRVIGKHYKKEKYGDAFELKSKGGQMVARFPFPGITVGKTRATVPIARGKAQKNTQTEQKFHNDSS